MKSKNVNIIANDLFEPLINFWKVAQRNKGELVAELRKVQPHMTKKILDKYRKDINTETDPIKRALYYFAINRSSFSGATFSGGFSQEAIEKRFTASSIDRLEKLDLSNCQFSNLHFKDFLKQIPLDQINSLIYADPPYYLETGSNLYGTKGDLHQNFQHEDFFQCITEITTIPWVISYNDCPYIREKYHMYTIQTVDWAYGMNNDKKSSEILIFGGGYQLVAAS